ncbi:protein kinase, partial [Helicosporidium sp. ATCC 50920]
RKRRRESDVGVSFAQESVSRNAVKDQNQMPFRVETTCSPPSAATGQRPSLSPFLAHAQDSSQRLEAPASASKKARNTIARYFASTSAGEGGSLGVGGHTTEEALRSSVAALEAAEQQASLHRLRSQKAEAEAASAREEVVELQAKLATLAEEHKQKQTEQQNSVRVLLVRSATVAAKEKRAALTRKLQMLAPRLGYLSVRRRGINVHEVWEDGEAFLDVKKRLAELLELREAIENARKAAKRRLPLPGQPLPSDRNLAGGSDGGAAAASTALHPEDWVIQEEIYKARLSALKREEEMLKAEMQHLEGEKASYIRDLKRVRDEEASRFAQHPVLNERYLLLDMLGRGGFSEVYRALDLTALQEVAVKIHQLSAQWSEAKKGSYVKHSVREYHIHKKLHHPRIVSLLDIFEIDNNTFATVLELCRGEDLDSYCHRHEALPEKEARLIVAQILSGLVYLNTKPNAIIHYDLKPANVLFDALGECRLTDFGLSKIVDDGCTQGMELTSQGAGTYWYLPPECFDVRKTPLISNKVDVWSLGVVHYQMLFGKRPFGHDQSQEQILRNEVMLNAREVQFPSRPAVSLECKQFIRECLAYRQEDRLDVHAAASHSYMSFKQKDKKAAKETAA